MGATLKAQAQVYREAWCHPCRINEGEEFTISWAESGPEVKKNNFYILKISKFSFKILSRLVP